MVYSEATDVRAQVPGIAANAAGAKAFVQRLVMQTVFDVLESQARSALLADAVISSILSQLEVNVTYVPMNCQKVVFNLMDMQEDMIDKCIIVGNTVTGICPQKGGAGNMMCKLMMLGAVPETHLTISGTVSTKNIIMANWSRTMWQSVVNRAIRMLALGPFGSNFFSASATVGGS
ncbi:hypothetical protein KIN20_002892 [Parelaphostrongylus tenuis]|uniref:Uncharacterized protein n=1 Tax=Parelaphostrongylus tenuis TaxID=148309 RepID=A0AAD5LVW9_PARTN|nr:hypothetical protein KIN20_002892 [Parelaphostrongylus tenuis]